MGTHGFRRLGWRGKLLLLLLAPLVFFGLFELVLRAVGFRYEGNVSPLEDGSRLEFGQKTVYQTDPELLWTLRRNSYLDYPHRGFPGIETNSEGLRGPELPGPRVPGEIRVLCLGDSVTFGLGLKDEETWPVRMKSALSRAPELEGRKVRVINGAVPGWSSVQGLRLLSRLTALEPDLVVFWFGMNDASPARGVSDSELRPGAAPSGLLTAARGLRVYQLLASILPRPAGPGPGTRVSPEEYRGAVTRLLDLERTGGPATLFVRVPERIDLTVRQLERVARRAEEEGVDLIMGPTRLLKWVTPAPEGCDLTGRRAVWRDTDVILFEPDPGEPTMSQVDGRIQRSALERDLGNLRALKRALDGHLQGLPPRSLDYAGLFGDAPRELVFRDNCHLTAFGSGLAGEALAAEALRILAD